METRRAKLVKRFLDQQNSKAGGAGGDGSGGGSGFYECSVCGFKYIYYGGLISDSWCKNCEKFEILENRLALIEKTLKLPTPVRKVYLAHKHKGGSK